MEHIKRKYKHVIWLTVFMMLVLTPALCLMLKTDVEAKEPDTEVLETTVETAAETMETEAVTEPDETVSETASETAEEMYVEQYPEVPLYIQQDYPDVPYGEYGTVSTHGCGVACLAMVTTYLTDTECLPDELAKRYGHYNTKGGSDWMLFPDTAEELGITILEQTWDRNVVYEYLKKGCVAIACCYADSIFTDSGHFVVLAGLTEDGKIIVRDSNMYNHMYGSKTLRDGYENGFELDQLYGIPNIWVYGAKDLDVLAEKTAVESVTETIQQVVAVTD